MLGFIDIIFLIFAFITLYFMIFFLVVYSIRGKNTPKKEFLGKISFIVPAYNEEDSIAETVKSIINTDYPRYLKEIVVVDDGSSDSTAEKARMAGAKVYRQPNRGKAGALNHGLEKATGKFIASVDADSFLTRDSVKEAMKYFGDKDVAAVTVTILVKHKKGLLARLQEFEYIMIAWARKNLEYVEGVFVTPGPMSIYRKDVLDKIGRFDETNLTEDIEMAWRILKKQYKIRMSTESLVYTNVPAKLKTWWRQRTRWNIGGLQTLNKYKYDIFHFPGSFSMFVLPFFTFSLIISLLGMSIITFLTADSLITTALYLAGTYNAGGSFIRSTELLILPNIFTVFGISIFILSVLYSKMNFAFYNRRFQEKRDYPAFFIYIAFYISVFPILLVYSIVKMLSGKREW